MRISVKKFTEWMIYLYILVVMVAESTGYFSVKVVRIFVMAALLLSFIKVASVRWVKSQYCLWAIVFLLYNIIMCQFAFSKSYAVDYTETLFYVIVIDVFICQYIYRNREVIWSILKAIICGALLKGILVYSQYGLFAFLTSRSVEGTSANTVGFYCSIAAVFSFLFYIMERKRYYIVIAVILIVFMIASASRKAFIFFGVPIIFYFLMKSKNSIKFIRNFILIIIVAVVGLYALFKVPFLYELIGNRIEGLINGLILGIEADASTSTRLSLIEFGMKYFKERPWFGYGMSNFKALVEVYRSWGSVYYAHNNYVELLVDCGIIGTIIYYSFYVKILIDGIKKRTPGQILVLGCMLGFIVSEYALVTYNDAIYQLLLLVFSFILADKKEVSYHMQDKQNENYISYIK